MPPTQALLSGEDGDYPGGRQCREAARGTRCSKKPTGLTLVNTKGYVIASVQPNETLQEHFQRPPHTHCEKTEPIKTEDKDVTRGENQSVISLSAHISGTQAEAD